MLPRAKDLGGAPLQQASGCSPAAAATHQQASAPSRRCSTPPRCRRHRRRSVAAAALRAGRRADGTTHLVARRPRADLAPTLCARRLQVSLALKALAARLTSQDDAHLPLWRVVVIDPRARTCARARFATRLRGRGRDAPVHHCVRSRREARVTRATAARLAATRGAPVVRGAPAARGTPQCRLGLEGGVAIDVRALAETVACLAVHGLSARMLGRGRHDILAADAGNGGGSRATLVLALSYLRCVLSGWVIAAGAPNSHETSLSPQTTVCIERYSQGVRCLMSVVWCRALAASIRPSSHAFVYVWLCTWQVLTTTPWQNMCEPCSKRGAHARDSSLTLASFVGRGCRSLSSTK